MYIYVYILYTTYGHKDAAERLENFVIVKGYRTA